MQRRVLLPIISIVLALLVFVNTQESCVTVKSSVCNVNGMVPESSSDIATIDSTVSWAYNLYVNEVNVTDSNCLHALKSLMCSISYPTCNTTDSSSQTTTGTGSKVCMSECMDVATACNGILAEESLECSEDVYSDEIGCTMNNSGLRVGAYTTLIVLISTIVSIFALLQ
jgi:hypothetical protein